MLGFEDVLPPALSNMEADVDGAAQQLEATQLANGPTSSPPQEDANGFFEQGGPFAVGPLHFPPTLWATVAPCCRLLIVPSGSSGIDVASRLEIHAA